MFQLLGGNWAAGVFALEGDKDDRMRKLFVMPTSGHEVADLSGQVGLGFGRLFWRFRTFK